MLLDAECTHDASICHVAKGGSEALLLLLRGRGCRNNTSSCQAAAAV